MVYFVHFGLLWEEDSVFDTQETTLDETADRVSAVSHEKLLLAYKSDVSSVPRATVSEGKEKQS